MTASLRRTSVKGQSTLGNFDRDDFLSCWELFSISPFPLEEKLCAASPEVRRASRVLSSSIFASFPSSCSFSLRILSLNFTRRILSLSSYNKIKKPGWNFIKEHIVQDQIKITFKSGTASSILFTIMYMDTKSTKQTTIAR